MREKERSIDLIGKMGGKKLKGRKKRKREK